jgi:hypothetical protein
MKDCEIVKIVTVKKATYRVEYEVNDWLSRQGCCSI